MHKSSLICMEWFVSNFLNSASTKMDVLDVGSCDINGCYKSFFDATRFNYTGLDIASGPNVDVCVSAPYRWNELADISFDVVISGRALEQTDFFWFSMPEITRVLRPNGFICIIASQKSGCRHHSAGCRKFTADGLMALARYGGLTPLHASTNPASTVASQDWYSITDDSMLVAQKPPGWQGLVAPE